MSLADDLTIVSVSCFDGHYLTRQKQLMEDLAGEPVRWLVVTNCGYEELPGFQTLHHEQYKVRIPLGARQQHRQSYWHAAGLNLASHYLRTRYVLYMDPDFFLAQPLPWMLERMQQLKLAAMGAGLCRGTRVQQTPCVFSLLLDTEILHPIEISFDPDVQAPRVLGDTGCRLHSRLESLPHLTASCVQDGALGVYCPWLSYEPGAYTEYCWPGGIPMGLHARIKSRFPKWAPILASSAVRCYLFSKDMDRIIREIHHLPSNPEPGHEAQESDPSVQGVHGD